MENGLSQDLIDLGAGFMSSGLMGQSDRDRGYPRGSTYMRGRLAALGDIDANQAARTLGIFPTKNVAYVWSTTADWSPRDAMLAYQRIAGEWADSHLSDDDSVRPALEALTSVVETADVPEDTIFASWREYGDDDLTGDLQRFYWGLVQLRELRGLRHFQALEEQGLTPDLAVILNERQEPGPFLRFAGYDEEASASLFTRAEGEANGKARWEAAEEATESAFEADLDVLNEQERKLLADAISAQMARVREQRAAG